MTIENITIGQIAVAIAFVVALVKSIDFIIDKISSPHNKLKKRHDDDIVEIKKQLEDKADKEVIDEIRNDIKMILHMEVANTEHNLYGNHVEDMQKAYERMKSHLIDS